MKQYYPRIADEILEFKLESSGAVIIIGPKWCGKSTTALQKANSVVYMQDSENCENNKALAKNAPSLFLSGKTPRLIDEWQIIPFIKDAIRFEIDKRDEFGQFILTGSATPISEDPNSHSGIGRITTMIMRTMSLYESKDSNGSISLKSIFDGLEITPAISNVDLLRYAFLICRGGWPKSVGLSDRIALQLAINYYDGLIEEDISKVDGIRRDRDRASLILRAYSRNIGSQASFSTLKNDLEVNYGGTIDEDTIVSYVNALKKLFVIEELRAWCPYLRSKTVIRTSNTRQLIDPSIGCAALDIGPQDLINDLNTMGFYFESMAIRDLRIYAEKLGGNVYHYRDSKGREVDAVIHLRNGDYGLVEIKMCDNEKIEESCRKLIKFVNDIDDSKMRKPKFLMVITATEYAYKRKEDGIYIVPLACLKD